MSVHRLRHRAPARPSLTAFLLLFVSLLALSAATFAGSLSLAWDAVAGATGYKLSYGTNSGSYPNSRDVGNQTSDTVPNLTDGQRYYFAVQAYNATATSPYSDEISGVAPTTTTPPVASFTANGSTASSLSVTQGQSVTFVDTSTGTVASRSWSLGDGTTASSATVVKSYSTTGAKTVRLSVTGAGVTRSASKTINVTATTAAPVASFTAAPTSGTAPLSVQFTDTSTGFISSRSWSFGTGATSTWKNPSYTFSSPGTYTVSLTVTGSGGSNTATKTGYITVGSTSGGGGSGGGTSGVPGLVAAYGFEEASGNQVLDTSGNGNHGTLAYVTRSASGKFGKALSFNGTNSWVTVQDTNSLDLTSGLTLSAWVYPTTWASGWSTLLAKQKPDGFVYSLFANSSQGNPNSTLDIRGTYRELYRGSHLPTNAWTHLAVTYDGAYHKLWVNGEGVGKAQLSGSVSVSGGPLRIGGHAWAKEFFQGRIDEVRVYNRALKWSEIRADLRQPVAN